MFGFGYIVLDCPNKKVEMLKDDQKVSSPYSSSCSLKSSSDKECDLLVVMPVVGHVKKDSKHA